MRGILGVLFAGALVLVPISGAAQSVTVVVNGQTMNFAQPPIVRAGRVFVPLRGVFEQLGASVVYANGQVNATRGGRAISLTIGSTQATVGGQAATIDVAPFIVGATTFVPLRFISQALGAGVNWNDSTSTVTINAVAAAPPAPAAPPPPRAMALVSQWPTGTVYTHSPQIRFRVNRPLQAGTFQVLVDGRDVSQAVQQTGPSSFAVSVPWSLRYGVHRVRVTGNTARGVPFSISWTFTQGSY